MQNPYTPPETAIAEDALPDEPDKRSSWLLIGSLLVTIVLSIIAAVVPFVVAAFAEVFKSFGADLPAPTVFVISSAPYWGIVPLFAAVFTVHVWRQKIHTKRYRAIAIAVFVGLGILAVAIFPIFAMAMYMPIFKLGSAV